MCVSVFVCGYVCVSTHVRAYACVFVWGHAQVSMCMCVHTCVCCACVYVYGEVILDKESGQDGCTVEYGTSDETQC